MKYGYLQVGIIKNAYFLWIFGSKLHSDVICSEITMTSIVSWILVICFQGKQDRPI